jgi:2-oxo-3-hexenedioate decarboxylase
MPDLRRLAIALTDAEVSAQPIAQLTLSTSLKLADAYAVQLASIDQRVRNGDGVVGLKLGFTSREKALQMGVDEVILGVLTGSRDLGATPEVSVSSMIHPRIEPEVAFLLTPEASQLDLTDPNVSLIDHVTHVAAAVELIDSRYQDFRFTVEDVVADNTSAARFLVGEWMAFASLRHRLDDLSVSLLADGREVGAGNTRAILGNPLDALGAVQRIASRYGHTLPPSAVILAGAATAAVPIVAGVSYEASVQALGSVTVWAKA